MKKIIGFLPFTILSAGIITGCGNNEPAKTGDNDSSALKKGIMQSGWGETDGKQVSLFTLTNSRGTQVKISNYGATITSWVVADKSGNKNNIVLGFDKLDGYLAKPPYFGATVGRYGNRIADAKFTLDGKTYNLAANNGKNSLHGGLKGFDKVIWDVAPGNDSTPVLALSYVSKDGEEGFPGNLQVKVTFTLTDDDALQIEYNAQTDKATVLNLTNHSYFNLTGSVDNTILDHVMYIDADKYTPVDTTLIPTGELKVVKGTPFDFTTPTKIGARIDQVPGGYDHNFVLNKQGNTMQLAAAVTNSLSGRKLEVFTMEPGIQFYTGNFLDGTIKSDNGKPIKKNTAFCLETQHFPNSPNKPAFPSVVLRPGQQYSTTTSYKVSLMP